MKGKSLSVYAGAFLGVILLFFFLFTLLGNPADALSDQRGDQQVLRQLNKHLGWDQPFWKKLLLYSKSLLPFGTNTQQQLPYRWYIKNFWIGLPSLGVSFVYKQPVLYLYLKHLKATLLLILPSLLFALTTALLLAILSVMFQLRSIDFLASIGMALPSFFAAIVLVFISILFFPSLPSSGYIEQFGQWDSRYFWLPFFSLSVRPIAVLYHLQKQSLLRELHQPYLTTAKAKGLSTLEVLVKHALPNAFLPVFTSFTNWFASLIAGTFFIEYIFHWPGIGTLMVQSLLQRDYPLVLGIALCTSFLFLCTLIVTDFIARKIDPRIQS